MVTTETSRQITEKQTQRRTLAGAAQLRIAVVSDAVQGRNGVGTYYPDLISHLRPLVASIELFCPTGSPDARLERFSVPMPGDASQRLVWPRTPELRRRLNRQSPHLIVIPAIGPFSSAAWRYAKQKRLPVVLANHTNFDQILSLYLARYLAAPLRWGLNRYHAGTFARATAIAAVDPEGFEQARSLGGSLVRMMGTPIPPEFVCTPNKQRSGPVRRIVFVGRLATEKGIPSLIDAARELSDLNFIIAGDGPLRERVQQASETCENLEYCGWLSRKEVLSEIDNADALILPSSVETFGTVALEALARRRYVVVRRECGIARWPTFAPGLFYIESDEAPVAALRRLSLMGHAELDAIASHSWDAVNRFGENTIRLWLDLLTDAAREASS